MNLLGLSGSEIVDTVRNFVVNLFVSLAQQWFWPAIFVGLMLLAVLVMISLVKGSYENKLLSISSMQSLIGKKRFDELLRSYVFKPKGKLTLANRDDDKRPEVTTAELDFKDNNEQGE